jgi:hypothetical protein
VSKVVWVYAVTTDLDAGRISGLTGVAGEPVRVVTEAGLDAVVGSVNGAVFGEKSLTSLLTDISSVETVGRAHHEVIASAASEGPVVPLRLATTYPDDATVAALLAERSSELAALLEAFTGTQEWGVKVYVEPWADAAEYDWLTGTASGLEPQPGREWRWVTAEAWAEKIGQVLNAIAVATRRHPSPEPDPAQPAGWLALHGAYLLPAQRSAEFTATVRALTAEHEALRTEVTGPWPPYSFAERRDLAPRRRPAPRRSTSSATSVPGCQSGSRGTTWPAGSTSAARPGKSPSTAEPACVASATQAPVRAGWRRA